ncbi:MAG: 50S ribosomal protein L20 [Dehalococcoidia bacterium]|jgi:large subunit ribosomal protein L20|nr:MAG: 50S ribosomal protein L20 [Dehalococcoidia bacterium]
MTRVKRGVTARRRHKKVISQTAGHRGGRHKLFRRANESLLHALAYAYRDRKDRKHDFRRLWIMRINAAARLHGTSYSQLVAALKRSNILIDRKMLADLAVSDPPAFGAIVKTALASA